MTAITHDAMPRLRRVGVVLARLGQGIFLIVGISLLLGVVAGGMSAYALGIVGQVALVLLVGAIAIEFVIVRPLGGG